MTDWLSALQTCLSKDHPCVLVTVAEIRGSTPRAAGAKMLVTAEKSSGSIGGGELEFKALELAQALLVPGSQPRLQTLPLGTTLEDTGSGAATLLFEPFGSIDFDIVLYGAGHVGKALVTVLGGVPCRITWIDSRTEQFPAQVPANVAIEIHDCPEQTVAQAPPGCYFLVMTHRHELDLRLSERILARGNFRYFGLIGSARKREQFEQRLLQAGMTPEHLQRMICPIGIAGIKGKQPAEIAIAVAAELLLIHNRSFSLASSE